MNTTEKTVELLPCPFCGEAAELVEFVDYGGQAPYRQFGVRCGRHADVVGMRAETEADAITAWNTRASPPPGNREAVLEVPNRPTRAWAVMMANQRQGRSSTPRCEPPGEYDIKWAHDRIAEVLEAARALSARHDTEGAGQ